MHATTIYICLFNNDFHSPSNSTSAAQIAVKTSAINAKPQFYFADLFTDFNLSTTANR